MQNLTLPGRFLLLVDIGKMLKDAGTSVKAFFQSVLSKFIWSFSVDLLLY